MSFRVGRWGQGLLLIVAGIGSPFVGIVTAGLAMREELQTGEPLGVAVYALLGAWVAAIVLPIVIGVVLHRLGKFAPPQPSRAAAWRTPEP